jgi:hypothetical protein
METNDEIEPVPPMSEEKQPQKAAGQNAGNLLHLQKVESQ